MFRFFSWVKLTNTPELRLGNQQFLLAWDFLPLSVKGKSKGMVGGSGKHTEAGKTPPATCFLSKRL